MAEQADLALSPAARRFAVDRLVLTPPMIDLSRSPLAGQFDAEIYGLGAFGP